LTSQEEKEKEEEEEEEEEEVSYLLKGYKQLVITWHASLLVICSRWNSCLYFVIATSPGLPDRKLF
jgi:hypothetical protein